MAWEQQSKAILMLNKLVEKRAIKCHKYWPDEIGAQYKMQLADVQLEVEYVKYEEFDHFSIRTLLLSDSVSGETREILQFHYTTWPDFGIPSSPNDFLRFLKMVRDSGAMSKAVGPVIVHCSAGIGRSGTFCLVDCCLTMLEEANTGEQVSVSDVLSELRTYRMGLIQTPDQLYFSYKAIIDGVKYFNDEVGVGICFHHSLRVAEINHLSLSLFLSAVTHRTGATRQSVRQSNTARARTDRRRRMTRRLRRCRRHAQSRCTIPGTGRCLRFRLAVVVRLRVVRSGLSSRCR